LFLVNPRWCSCASISHRFSTRQKGSFLEFKAYVWPFRERSWENNDFLAIEQASAQRF
jgi:hypothetical protein